MQFTKEELKKILDVKKCIASFINQQVREKLWNVFKLKEDDAQEHFTKIRDTISKFDELIVSEPDEQENLAKLLQLVFDYSWDGKTKLTSSIADARFWLTYEQILAVGMGYIDAQDAAEQIALQAKIAQQIEEDAKLAAQLQADYCSESLRLVKAPGSSSGAFLPAYNATDSAATAASSATQGVTLSETMSAQKAPQPEGI